MDTFADREIALLRSFLKSGDGNDLLVLADLYQEHNKAWEETLCRVLNGMPALRQATHELATVARQDLGTLSPDADDLAANTQYAWAEQEARKRVANGLWEFRWGEEWSQWMDGAEWTGKWSCTLRELTPVTGENDEVIGMNDRIVGRLRDIELGEGDRPEIRHDVGASLPATGHCRYVECELAFNALYREAWFEFAEWAVRPPDPKPLEVQPAILRRFRNETEIFALFPEFPSLHQAHLDADKDTVLAQACLMIYASGEQSQDWYDRMRDWSLQFGQEPHHASTAHAARWAIEAKARELGIQIEWVKRARPGHELRLAKRRKKYLDERIPF